MGRYLTFSTEEAKALDLPGLIVEEDVALAAIARATANAAGTDSELVAGAEAEAEAPGTALPAAEGPAPGGDSDAERLEASMRAAAVAANADAVIFNDGRGDEHGTFVAIPESPSQEPREGASEAEPVEAVAEVTKKLRRARRPAGGVDAGQFVPDDPAAPDVDEAHEPVEF